MALIPTVLEKSMDGERAFDIYSRLLRDRIIFVGSQIEENISNSVVAQLLLLEAEDPNKDITMYINSPGGSVLDGLAIINTMKYIKCDVRTVAIGKAASMGLAILSQGTPGKRCALEDAQILLHEVSSGTSGKIHDQRRDFEHSMLLNDKLMSKMAAASCGKSTKEELAEIAKEDIWLQPEEALEYGFIDEIIKER